MPEPATTTRFKATLQRQPTKEQRGSGSLSAAFGRARMAPEEAPAPERPFSGWESPSSLHPEEAPRAVEVASMPPEMASQALWEASMPFGVASMPHGEASQAPREASLPPGRASLPPEPAAIPL